MWKTIESEPNYEVSDCGKVRNKKTQFEKKLRFDRGGYLRVTLYPSGKTYLIHRLVATAFLEKPEGCNVVNHKDGVKVNNSICNLEWCDPAYNVNHAYKLGLNKHQDIGGEKNPMAKLTRESVSKIRELAESGQSWSKLAVDHGVQYNCIKRIVLGITWK